MYSWGLGVSTDSGINDGDSLLHVASTYKDVLGLASSALGLVSFLMSLVHVSVGVAQEQSLSMPRLLVPLMSLKVPFSPQ